jgi:hypothetical protein
MRISFSAMPSSLTAGISLLIIGAASAAATPAAGVADTPAATGAFPWQVIATHVVGIVLAFVLGRSWNQLTGRKGRSKKNTAAGQAPPRKDPQELLRAELRDGLQEVSDRVRRLETALRDLPEETARRGQTTAAETSAGLAKAQSQLETIHRALQDTRAEVRSLAAIPEQVSQPMLELAERVRELSDSGKQEQAHGFERVQAEIAETRRELAELAGRFDFERREPGAERFQQAARHFFGVLRERPEVPAPLLEGLSGLCENLARTSQEAFHGAGWIDDEGNRTRVVQAVYAVVSAGPAAAVLPMDSLRAYTALIAEIQLFQCYLRDRLWREQRVEPIAPIPRHDRFDREAHQEAGEAMRTSEAPMIGLVQRTLMPGLRVAGAVVRPARVIRYVAFDTPEEPPPPPGEGQSSAPEAPAVAPSPAGPGPGLPEERPRSRYLP